MTETMQLNMKYKKVAPDGGWGYMILIGMVFCLISTFGSMSSVSLMFSDFLMSLELETGALTLLPSCYFMAFSVVGIFANFLFNTFSIRGVAWIGGCIYFVGSLLTPHATSFNQLIVVYSIFEGVGFGLMLSVSYTRFNQYFVEKRVMMMGLAQSMLGLGSMGFPLIVEKLMSEYGYRGCMSIIAAINGHALFGMLIMHPVEWHMRTIEVTESTCIEPLTGGNSDLTDANNEDFKGDCLNLEKTKFKKIQRMVSVREKIVDFLDLSLLQELVYVNICIGMAFALFSDVSFFTIQPVYLQELKFTKSEIARIVSIGAGTDLCSRIFLTILCSFIKIRARHIYLAGTIFTIAARIAFMHVYDFIGIAAVTGVIGFFRAWIHVPIPIVFGDYLTPARFPSGYGLFMFIQGTLMFIMGPLIGWVRDYTGSYSLTFNILNAAMAVCAVPWTIEILWTGVKKNRLLK